MARLQKTLTDYVVIAISPALIITMITSLVYFLIDVYYQGSFTGRLHWIFGLFVMAAVLIARISIEEGREHASLFAVPLAIVTLLALFRFVEFRGPLAGLSVPMSVGLVVLIWWCADKLTWDCTVIDEQEDASGEGLLQTVGLDRPSGEAPQPADPTKDLEATTSRDASTEAKPAGGTNWWTRFIERRRRPHAPGVWVIYFSLGALPLFGIGQRFIPEGDLDARRSAFRLLCIYVASALGLLLTTSFLGLRRYLRQRRLEMPIEMAGVWLTVGSVMIVALLVFCAILPRPSPEYSVTQLDFRIGSPDDLKPSPYAAGPDGAEDREGRSHSAVTQQDAAQRGTEAKGGKQPSGKQPSGGQAGSKQAGGEQRGTQRSAGKSASSQDGASGGSKSQGGANGQRKGEGKSKGKRGDQAGGGTPQRDSRQGKNERDETNAQGRPPEKSGRSNASNARGGQHRRSSGGGGRSRDRVPNQPPSSRQTSNGKPKEAGADSESPSQQQRPEASEPGAQAPARKPTSSFQPTRLLNTALGGLPYLLKFLYYLIFFGIVGYLLWRYRNEVIAAVRGFLQAIREFWENLFGGRRAEAVGEQPEEADEAPARRFADFPDPFASGMARHATAEELVVYTFEALEAWAREHGCQRGEDQTPHEFAWRLASCAEHVGREAQTLADLYSTAAYAKQPLAPGSAQRLKRLWRALRVSATSDRS